MKEPLNNWPKDMKKTKQRECVLSVLENSERPLSATDIFSEMEKNDDSVWLSTVYRALEIFVKKGVVVKTNVMNSDMAVFELNRFEHKHYAVCINCHKIIAMDNCPMEKFIPELDEKDFSVVGHNFEIYGYCKDCKPKG